MSAAVAGASVAEASRVEWMPRAAASTRLGWLRDRGMGASVLVAALASAFGVVLLSATGYIGAILQSDAEIGGSEMLAFVLSFIGMLLLGVALYVAAVVTANTFATVVAGRTRRIALLRLIGASARSQRAEVANQGLIVGTIGAVIGLLIGTGLAAAMVAVGGRMLGIGDVPFDLVQPLLVLPAAIVALTTWGAAWVGSRRVLTVTPLEALGGSVEASHAAVARRSGRHGVAIALFAIGAALLVAGIALGLVSPLGLVVAFFGGLFSFTGLVLGSTLIMPPALQLVGRAFGGSATARLAAQNALRYPERSSRMAIGLVIGVTLVTMFAVAIESTKAVLTANAGGELPQFMATLLDTFAGVMMALVGVSAVIAAVGLVNLLTLGVVQRRRELGLLRALGFSNSQVRRLVLLEAAHITITATATGLVLGVIYGWAGAQSLLGSVPTMPGVAVSSLVPPAVPVWPVLAIIVCAAALTLVAAVVPTRLATRVVPVEALAAE